MDNVQLVNPEMCVNHYLGRWKQMPEKQPIETAVAALGE